MNDLELLAPLGEVDPADEDTLREVAAVFVAEMAKEPEKPVRRGKPLVLAGGAAVAVIVAAVILVANLTSTPPRSAQDVRGLVLAAFDSTDLISHQHTVITDQGGTPMTTDEWYSTIHPKSGQRMTQRGVVVQGSKLDQDSTETFTVPASAEPLANCTYGDDVTVDHIAKTWRKASNTCLLVDVAMVTDFNQAIGPGRWALQPGTTTIDGRQAVELTRTDGDTHWTVWADADSYLPIRSQLTSLATRITTDYAFLPDTPENRAQLRTPIPPGYRQVPFQQ